MVQYGSVIGWTWQTGATHSSHGLYYARPHYQHSGGKVALHRLSILITIYDGRMYGLQDAHQHPQPKRRRLDEKFRAPSDLSISEHHTSA